MRSLCRLPVAINHNFGQIVAFLGAPVSTPFYRWGPNLVCYSRPAVYAYVPNFASIGLFCRPVGEKNPIFAVFGFRHLVSSPNGNSLTKLNTAHNCKLSPIQGPNIVSVLQRLHGEISAQSLTIKKRNEQTDNLETVNVAEPLQNRQHAQNP